MKIEFHKIDRYFIYPRATTWISFDGKRHTQIGFFFNIEIITNG